MKTGFEDLIYSATFRCYCKCGGQIIINSNLESGLDAVGVFWEEHNKKACGPTTPPKAARARRKADDRRMEKL